MLTVRPCGAGSICYYVNQALACVAIFRCLSVCKSVCMYVCLSVCMSVSVPVSQLTDKQFTFIALNARTRLRRWTEIELLFLTKVDVLNRLYSGRFIVKSNLLWCWLAFLWSECQRIRGCVLFKNFCTVQLIPVCLCPNKVSIDIVDCNLKD